MKRCISILLTALLAVSCSTENPGKGHISQEESEISEALGHMLYMQMSQYPIDIDIDMLVKGLRDAQAGKEPPMTLEEMSQRLMKLVIDSQQTQSTQNLQEAEEYLAKNGQLDGMVVREEGKLQWKVLEEGKGAQVQENSRPEVSYIGKYMDGTIFDQSSSPVAFELEDTIVGFQKGIAGMREGETRRLFIHPDLGYGTRGRLPPNSLLIFDVTVEKADKIDQ